MTYKKFPGAASAALMIVIAILMLAPGAWAQSKFKTLHKFTGGKDGGHPYADLILDAAGNLYGTTEIGGDLNYCNGEGCGVVFQLTRNSDGNWREHVLHLFGVGGDGENPDSTLIFDAMGNLYGTTVFGGAYNGGSVFKLTPNSNGKWTESVLYSFAFSGDGFQPYAGLVFDSGGNLYGTTAYGGAHNYGTVFQLTPNRDGSWTESLLHSFINDGRDGVYPSASMIFDKAGHLYGTTFTGGIHGSGIIFELTSNLDGSWTENVLYNFTQSGKNGFFPEGSLALDGAGNLYGSAGGGNIQCGGVGIGCGVAFELLPNPDGNWTEKVLHRFNDKGGKAPLAGLTFDPDGNLYGTTAQGGKYGVGVVFKLTPGADGKWKEHVLHSFRTHPGANPHGGVIVDAAGNIYGTTTGNALTFGSVFEITP